MTNQPEVAGVPTPRPKSSCSPDDVKLLERLRDGDRKAMRTVSDQNWSPVYRHIRQIVGSHHAAEDVVQETLIRFWGRRAKWRPQKPIRAILLRVAENLSKDLFRARRTRCDCLASWPRPAGSETPYEVVERNELHDAVRSAVRELPERRQQALVLVHFEGRSYQEAAHKMGISPQTIANHVTAARKDLRLALASYADFER